jgi:hypothetical protein
MSDARTNWLGAVVDRLRPTFTELRYPLPERLRVRVSVAAFASTGTSLCVGVCADPVLGETVITLSPVLDTPDRPDLASFNWIAALTHELVHAAIDAKLSPAARRREGEHGRKFARLAGRLGLLPPWPTIKAGDEFVRLVGTTLAGLGLCPAADPDAATHMTLDELALALHDGVTDVVTALPDSVRLSLATAETATALPIIPELYEPFRPLKPFLCASRAHFGGDYTSWWAWLRAEVFWMGAKSDFEHFFETVMKLALAELANATA